MLKHLLENHPETSIIVEEFLKKLRPYNMDRLIDSYSNLLSQNKITLIKAFLHWKIDMLFKLRYGERNET